ncbi:MAG: ATP-binding protein [Methanophagales archaeon]|nr:ATP-binding protein [Methanophagales archaeon]
MEIVDFNPWWETGTIDWDTASMKRRDLFPTLKESLEARFIEIIIGLRRVGKTVLMHQLIAYLLNNGIDAKRIFYYSFDIERKDLNKVIKEYEAKILHDKIKEKHIFLFFDEIHKLEDWENKVKVLYDLNPGVKCILSGSASLNLMRRSRESLAGRARFHYLPPLSFKEFIEFRGEKIPEREEFEIYRRKLDLRLGEFMYKGFPETLEMEERKAREYVRELIAERIIYRDIPETFRIEDFEILRILADYIFKNPGVILNIDSLSRDLGRHKKTVRNALNYLELSFLIKRVSNLRGSFLSTSRKNRKAYPLHPALSLSKDEDRNLECLVRSETNAECYWRKQNYEVDFVLKNDKVIPVEVKNKERIGEMDLKGLLKFCSLVKLNEGFVVSRGDERSVDRDGVRIMIVPVSRFLFVQK